MSTTFMHVGEFQVGRASAFVFDGKALLEVPPKPATEANRAPQRAYLKALRHAELEAWHNQGGQIEASAAPLLSAQAELADQRGSEGRLFAVVGAIAAAALVVAFREPLKLAEHWISFVQFVQQLLS